jgi:hypothetical protein
LARNLSSVFTVPRGPHSISTKRNNGIEKVIDAYQIGKLNMGVILEPAAFRREQKISETNCTTAGDLTPEPSVALVTGGAVIGFDNRVHIDLDRSHTVLSPDEARQFAAKLKRIAAAIDPFPGRKRGE